MNQKVNKLLEIFDFTFESLSLQEKKLLNKNSKIWNIDTDIFGIMQRFFDNIKTLVNDNFSFDKPIKIKKIHVKRFQIWYEDINITPTTKRKKYSNDSHVAYSTMWQYLRLLNYFDLIIIPDTRKKRFLDSIDEIEWSINIDKFTKLEKIDNFFNLENLGKYISWGIKRDIFGYRDISYSIIICLIYKLDINKMIFNEKNVFISNLSFKVNKKIDGKSTNEFSIYEKVEKALKDTYSGIINLYLYNLKKELNENDEYIILEKIVDEIFLNIESNDFDKIDEIKYSDSEKILNFKKEILDEINFSKEIANARQKLRNNILKTRNINMDLHYSDIEPIDEKINFVHDCVDQQEAAHIISVSQIKKEIQKYRKKNDQVEVVKLFDLLSNPSNGILMDHVYHDSFDRGWIRFNTKGEMIPTYKWMEKYYDSKNKVYIKYPLMKIKKDVLDKTMKKNINSI